MSGVPACGLMCCGDPPLNTKNCSAVGIKQISSGNATLKESGKKTQKGAVVAIPGCPQFATKSSSPPGFSQLCLDAIKLQCQSCSYAHTSHDYPSNDLNQF